MATPRVKIAHLSDLHFGLSRSPLLRKVFDKRVLDSFADHIVIQNPQLIIASGDLANNPTSWQLRQACQFLERLCRNCRLSKDRLVVIPGNHDVSFLGNLGYKPFTSRWFDRVYPSWRGRRYLFDKDLGIFVYWFDSNPSKFSSFARGQVTQDELQRFKQCIEGHRGSKEAHEFLRSFKIAVVHHHPMAVPYSGSDTFLLLNGAGDFLSEMAKHNVDLVIHGHKHHWGFSRARIYPRDEDIRVLAGGTAGRLGDQPRYNLITLLSDGTAEVKVFYVPPGGTVEEETGKRTAIFDLEGAKTRAFLRNVQACDRHYRQISAVTRVTAEGDVHFRKTFKGMQTEPGTDCANSQTFAIRSDTGYVRGVKAWMETSDRRFELPCKPDKPRPDLHSGRWTLDFERSGEASSDPVGFEYGYWILNGMARNQEDARVMYELGREPYESAWVGVTQPTKKLSFRIVLENSPLNPKELKYIVRAGDDKTEGSLSEDFREGADVREGPPFQIDVSVENPCVGYVYEVKWPLHAVGETQDSASAAQARFLRNQLLKLIGKQDGSLADLINKKLTAMQEWLRSQAPFHDSAEEMDLSLMVWDEEKRVLRTVASLLPPEHRSWSWEVHFGDGLAGRTLKLRKRLLYIADHIREEKHRYYISAEEAGTEASAFKHRILLSEPVLLGDTIQEVLGVLNVGSNSDSSALYRFASPDSAEAGRWERWSQEKAGDLAVAICEYYANPPKQPA
ncbi:MAG TPA: metallophosphoesterase [Terriglobia bacterium]